MFSKKKKQVAAADAAPKKELHIEAMPQVFYGGKNPHIYDAPAKKKKEPKKQKVTEAAPVTQPVQTPQIPQAAPSAVPAVKKVAPDKVAPGQQVIATPQVKKKGNTVLIIVLLAVIILAGVSWYVVSDTLKQQEPVPVPPTPPVTTDTDNNNDNSDNTNNQVTGPIILPTTTPSIPSSSVPSATDSIDFPRTIFSTAVDLDSDDLTDQEEEIFGTDSGTWDSDGDGYYDGQEVANLYNPNGFAPRRIIDSGLVREYINPAFQYRLYYPLDWEPASVDPQSTQVLISAITGDYIEVRTFEKLPNQAFSAWFTRHAVGQRFTDLEEKTNRFDIEGFVRRDGLVAYIDTTDTVYVLLYHPGTAQRIVFPHVMNMVFQSFRPSRVSLQLPDQVVLPTSTVFSTTTEPAISPTSTATSSPAALPASTSTTSSVQ